MLKIKHITEWCILRDDTVSWVHSLERSFLWKTWHWLWRSGAKAWGSLGRLGPSWDLEPLSHLESPLPVKADCSLISGESSLPVFEYPIIIAPGAVVLQGEESSPQSPHQPALLPSNTGCPITTIRSAHWRSKYKGWPGRNSFICQKNYASRKLGNVCGNGSEDVRIKRMGWDFWI